jgi:hypothetical protein
MALYATKLASDIVDITYRPPAVIKIGAVKDWKFLLLGVNYLTVAGTH